MVGILIVTHGSLANSFIESARVMVGTQDRVLGIGLFEEDAPDALEDKILQGIQKVDDGDGVLVLTDIYGGTPSNRVAYSSAKTHSRLACVTGINFPMFIDCLLSRGNMTLEQLGDRCVESGRSGIKDLLKELSQRRAQ